MPTELEIAAAEKAAREVAPRVGGFSARVVAKAALEAAEKVRMGGALRKTELSPLGLFGPSFGVLSKQYQ